MPATPTVTVWIPSYNHAKFLAEAIESVLNQTFQDFELVVVDDGSADESLAIALSYQTRFPKTVRVFWHPNKANLGISATVNRAMELARGRFFCALPSDDKLPPDSLQVRLRHLEPVCNSSFVYGNILMFDSNNPAVQRVWGDDISNLEEPLTAFFSRNPISGMSAMSSREAWLATGKHDESLHFSDWDFWMRMAAKWKPQFIPHVVAYHRQTGRNATWDGGKLGNWKHSLEVLLAARRKLPAMSAVLQKPANNALLEVHCGLLKRRLGDPTAAEHLLNAVAADPPTVIDPKIIREWVAADAAAETPDAGRIVAAGETFCEAVGSTVRPRDLRRIERMVSECVIQELCLRCPTDAGWAKARQRAWQLVKKQPLSTFRGEVLKCLVKATGGPRFTKLTRWLRRGLNQNSSAEDLPSGSSPKLADDISRKA